MEKYLERKKGRKEERSQVGKKEGSKRVRKKEMEKKTKMILLSVKRKHHHLNRIRVPKQNIQFTCKSNKSDLLNKQDYNLNRLICDYIL